MAEIKISPETEKEVVVMDAISFHEVQFVFIPKKEWRLIEFENSPYIIICRP